nr:hypothetical protein Iba_chr12eCG5880 [Ipomoea batatas]
MDVLCEEKCSKPQNRNSTGEGKNDGDGESEFFLGDGKDYGEGKKEEEETHCRRPPRCLSGFRAFEVEHWNPLSENRMIYDGRRRSQASRPKTPPPALPLLDLEKGLVSMAVNPNSRATNMILITGANKEDDDCYLCPQS